MESLLSIYDGPVIYQIINLKNNSAYIGCTNNFFLRKMAHLYLLRSNKHTNHNLQEDFQTYEEDSLLFDIIEFVDKEDMLQIREAYWISKLNPYYNMQFPGEREITNITDFLARDDYHECILVETSPEMIEAVKIKTKISEEKIRSMLQYNIFTIKQYSHLTNMLISTIVYKLKPKFVSGHMLSPELDICYPFPSGKSKGQKYIVRNEKAEKYLKA